MSHYKTIYDELSVLYFYFINTYNFKNLKDNFILNLDANTYSTSECEIN